MSITAVIAVLESPIAPTPIRLTAVTLAVWCNDAGGSLYPSMDEIARRVGVSRSQAQRNVHRLVEMGLLSVVANAAGGKPGVAPQYQLHLDRITAMSQTGRKDATGRADATGRTDAAEGSHACSEGAAPMRQRGRIDATQKVIKGHREVKERKVRAPALTFPCPDDVPPQVWVDWLALRAKKRATVSNTVVDGARGEAEKAGMTFEAFLRIWCLRGSQGLEASWLKPNERAPANGTKHSGFDARNHHKGVSDDGVLRI